MKRWSLTIVAGLLLLLGLASPAAAHTELVSSDPAAGSTLTASPAAITLTFSEDVLEEGASIAISLGGRALPVGPVGVDGPTVSVGLVPIEESGEVTVAWRAVADDGHPVTGTFTFVLDLTAPAPTSASPTSASPAPTSATPSPSPTSGPAAASGASPWPFVLAAAALIAVVAAAVAHRRRSPAGDSAGDSAGDDVDG